MKRYDFYSSNQVTCMRESPTGHYVCHDEAMAEIVSLYNELRAVRNERDALLARVDLFADRINNALDGIESAMTGVPMKNKSGMA